MPTVSVIVPVFYNEHSLPALFAELLKIEEALRTDGLDLELIFVDDGSGDRSFGELLRIKEARPATRLVRLTRNFGAVQASRTGLGFVTGDCVLVLAADLQDPPDLILAMVKKWQGGAKYVIAERSDRDDPFLSKVFSRAYYWLLRRFVAPHYPKGGYDLALMDGVMLPHLQHASKNVHTPLLAFWLGFEPVIITYKRRKRLHGRSRWTFNKKLTAAIDALFGFSNVPIRAVSIIGLLVSTLSFLYAAWIVVNAVLGRTDVRGFATIVALLAFLQGLGIVMLGVIGEYIWRIFDEINHRPEAVIETVD
jgi:dolichol-phosphate mannosyltransferase